MSIVNSFTFDNADVGLGNVDNTSDVNKPVSTAQQTALDLKVDDTEITNIDNTSDVNKPVSTAQQTALDLKANKGTTNTYTAAQTFNSTTYFNGEVWAFSGGSNRLLFGESANTGDYGGLNWTAWSGILSLSNTGYGTNIVMELHPDGDVEVAENLICPLAPTVGDHLCNKTYVDSVAKPVYIPTFLQGLLIDDEKLFTYLTADGFDLPSGLTGSVGYVDVVATAATTIDIRKNGSSVGSIDFALGANTATFTFTTLTSFAVGDRLTLFAPSTADVTLADISVTLKGTRP